MTSFAIITDDAAQLSPNNSSGIVSFITINHLFFQNKNQNTDNYFLELASSEFLPSTMHPQIMPPSRTVLTRLLTDTINAFDEVFCITTAKGIDLEFSMIEDITSKYKGRANFHLIDSQTLSSGEGFLVDYALSLIEKNTSATKIDELLRDKIPNIYTILCAPDFSYLYSSRFIDAGQMLIGEQHSLYPIFSIEEGKLNPIEKQKNLHGVIEYLIEFLAEYDHLEKVFFIHPTTELELESKLIQQAMGEFLPKVPLCELSSNEYFTRLLGSRGFGLIAIE